MSLLGGTLSVLDNSTFINNTYYDLTIKRGYIAPDGYNRSVILINDQFPGPLLEANWGDYFSITVHNEIYDPEEGTILHWHGLTQKVAPWYDGVASVQQCPIAPGASLTYKFQADLYGTSWYHSHYSAQYARGLLGPMVIYGPKNADYDIDLSPIVTQDYFHKDYFTLVSDVESTNFIRSQITLSQNTLVQGKMDYDCNLIGGVNCTGNMGLAKFNFTPSKTHRLRFINTGAQAHMVISIDEHTMTVIANDFVPIVPYETNIITLGVGQRTDVLVTANADGDAFWLRVRQPILSALAGQPFGLAAIYYNGADTTQKPKSLAQPDWFSPTLIHCANDPLSKTVPFYSIEPPVAETTQKITIDLVRNATGHYNYEMNGVAFRGNYNHPILLEANAGNFSYPDECKSRNAYNFGSNTSMIIYFENKVPFSHPLHVHGQNMYVPSEGIGAWDGTSVIHPSNPMHRDTQILQPNGYLIALLIADNPGVWPFHCHIAFHVSGGLYVNVLQKPEGIMGLDIPGHVKGACDAWMEYTDRNVVDQIDYGV